MHHPVMLRTLAAGCVALALGSSVLAQDISYEREGDTIFRLENGTRFIVDPVVVSARFVPAVGGDFAGLLAALGDDAGVIADLTVVRSNRLGIFDLAIPQGADPLEVVAALRATGRVDFAEENVVGVYGGIAPNDPQFGQLWHLENTGQSGGTAGADVSAIEAWSIEDGDPSVIVAVLDSGTDYTHEDLAANMWTNAAEIPNNGIDDDSNGFVDDFLGWDFGAGDNDPMGSFDHGTNVAGVVGSVGNNGVGIAGLAGGGADSEGCRVMALNVGAFSPLGSILDDAIIYAADNGARVITMSLTVGSSTAINDATDYAWNTVGAFVDCAAGNNGSFGVGYPATLPDVVAVASSNRNDNISGFSSQGPEVEVAAPGEDILMTELGGGYGTDSGTSFSAPHVAALAGLIFSANPGLTNDEVRTILAASADDLGAPANAQGAGRINAASALSLATGGIIGSAVSYGAGLPGSFGLFPVIGSFGGAPTVGNMDFGVDLTRAAGSAPAYFVLGFEQASLPFKGGTLLVSPMPPTLIIAVVTSPLGGFTVFMPIANQPVLEGLVLDCQWVIEDAGAVQGFALTGGLEITIGS